MPRNTCSKMFVGMKHPVLSTPLVFFCADTTAIVGSFYLAVGVRWLSDTSLPLGLYADAFPWLLIFPLLSFLLKLYPGIFMPRPEEWKRQTIVVCVGFMTLSLGFFLGKQGELYSRMVLIFAWFFALFLGPFVRYLVRRYCGNKPWWGYRFVVFSGGNSLLSLHNALPEAAKQGIKSVCLVLPEGCQKPDIALLPSSLRIAYLSVESDEAPKAFERLASEYPQAYAVVDLASYDHDAQYIWLDMVEQSFCSVILIPHRNLRERAWAMAVNIGTMPGLLLHQNLLDIRRLRMKRLIDLLVTICAGVIIFPVLCLLTLAIKLDTPGPAFFRHSRIGRNGKPFMVFKFRTMAVNAQELLEKYLAEHPEMRAEWDATQKLKEDPRITRVGRFLRKTSLDELPQLLNVLWGDMSLVGPRPIVTDEIPKYGATFAMYTRVFPGITGLWQVSGRNDVSYEERITFDRYYICNWSVWLDIYIIARTIPEVLRCSGAY